jgi:hypothetical protein
MPPPAKRSQNADREESKMQSKWVQRLSDPYKEQMERILGEGYAERLMCVDELAEDELRSLREALGEEQFQAFMDELAEGDAHEH